MGKYYHVIYSRPHRKLIEQELKQKLYEYDEIFVATIVPLITKIL